MPEASQILRYYSGWGYFMSPDDQRAQKGAILLEYQEVQEQINALHVKAQRLGERISEFGRLLQKSPAEQILREDQPHHSLAHSPTHPDLMAAMRGWQESFEIADNLRQAIVRSRELHQQKERLGLK
jgi:hypothetical protein